MEKQLKNKTNLNQVECTSREVKFEQTTIELQIFLKTVNLLLEHLKVEKRKKVLIELLRENSDFEYLKECLKAIYEREQIFLKRELTTTHYNY